MCVCICVVLGGCDDGWVWCWVGVVSPWVTSLSVCRISTKTWEGKRFTSGMVWAPPNVGLGTFASLSHSHGEITSAC